MSKQIIQGLGTALVTPFTETGKVDETALHRLLDRQLAAKVDFLVVLGTTGEAATMTAREQAFVRKTIVEHVAGRVPLVLGVGGNCTQEVVERLGMLNTELKRDYAAILSVCPYYNKPQQEGLYRHFAAIAEASAVPVILYNVPGRTGVNMLPETVFRLAAGYPHKIIGVKEASGKQEQIEAIIRRVFCHGIDCLIPVVTVLSLKCLEKNPLCTSSFCCFCWVLTVPYIRRLYCSSAVIQVNDDKIIFIICITYKMHFLVQHITCHRRSYCCPWWSIIHFKLK